MPPDLTEARDIAAMWQARAVSAEAIATKLARDVWAAIGFRDDPTVDRDLDDVCGFVGQQARLRFDDLAIGRDNHHTRASIAEAIIRGRDVAPTDAEVAAHEAADGLWLALSIEDGQPARNALSVISPRGRASRGWRILRWWPLDADGRPCAWPVAP